MTLGEELLQDQIDRLEEDKRDMTNMLALAIHALEKIASPTQTKDLLWWQIEAREALAKVGAGGTAPNGLHPTHEPWYAASVALGHNV